MALGLINKDLAKALNVTHSSTKVAAIREATSVCELINNPRSQDVFVIDIDETLLYTGIEKYKTTPKLTEKNLPQQLKALQESGHQIILLSARKASFSDETKKQLGNLGLHYDVLLHASHETVEEESEKRSTKGEVLKKYLSALSEGERGAIKRLIVIDKRVEDLESIALSLADKSFFEGQLSLNHYEPERQLLDTASEKLSFPKRLSDASVIQSLGGGTESTYVVSIDGKRYVLKHGASEEALKMEVLSNVLYRALGVAVPSLQCYGVMPKDLAKRLSLPHTKVAVQLAEKIRPAKIQSESIISAQVSKDFIIHAFLGNIDLKPDNFIVTESGDAILIDAGANFIFRSLGKDREEDPSTLTEVFSLRDPKKKSRGAKWFSGLSENDLKNQALSLLRQRDVIEKTVWETVNQLDFSPLLKEQIINGYAHRFEQLAVHFGLENIMLPQVDKIAMADSTAGGILTLKKSADGELLVLLSKRVRHDWYDNFGGKSDKADKNLAVTASREVYEESSGQLYYAPDYLMTCPFHDIITLKKGKKHLYRLYFTLQDKEFELFKLTDHEHTAHSWVAVAELLSALETRNEIQLETEMTVAVESKKGDKTPLFPPLYHLLKQAPTQALLRDFISTKHKKMKDSPYSRQKYVMSPTAEVETASRQEPHPTMALLRPLPSIVEVEHTVIQTLLEKKKSLESIKSKQEKSIEALDVGEGQAATPIERLSQSELHLKLLLGDKFKTDASIEDNVKAYFDAYWGLYRGQDIASLIRLCAELIKEERRHPDKVFFYHGCNDKVAYAYQVYTVLYQTLRVDKRYESFRADHPLFKSLHNIDAFIDYYQKKGGGKIDNYSEDFMALALSCNLFLFGNHCSHTSHTLYYFMKNDTRKEIELGRLFDVMFKPLGIPKGLIKEVTLLYQSMPHKGRGMLYQLCLAQGEADKLSYAAGQLGVLKPAPVSGSHIPSQVLSEMRVAVIDGKGRYIWEDYSERLQARLMAPPESNIKTKKMRFGESQSVVLDEGVAVFEARLEALAQQMAHYYLKKGGGHSTKKAGLPLLKQKKQILATLGLKESTSVNITEEMIESLIAGKKTAQIKQLVLQTPSLLTDPLPKEKSRNYLTSHKAGRGESSKPKTLLDMLIRSKKMTDCLYDLYGERFYATLNVNLCQVALAHLKESNRADFLETLKATGHNYIFFISLICIDLSNKEEKRSFLNSIRSLVTGTSDILGIFHHSYSLQSNKTKWADDKFDVATAFQHLIINADDLITIIHHIEGEDRVRLAVVNNSVLRSEFDIKNVLKKLESCSTTESFLDSIKDRITDIDAVKRLLNSFACQAQILTVFDHLIKNKFDLIEILPTVPTILRCSLIEKHANKIERFNDIKIVGQFLTKEETANFVLQHANKITKKSDIRAAMNLLSEAQRVSFAKQCQHHVQEYDNLKMLGECFSDSSNREAFFEAHLDKIQTFQQFKSMLSLLSIADRYPLAQQFQIPNGRGKHLYELLCLLQESDQKKMILKQSYSFSNIKCLFDTLKLVDHSQRLNLIEENITLIIHYRKIDDVLLILPEAGQLPAVLDELSKVHDVRDLLNYLNALPKERQYPTLLAHGDKIRAIGELNVLLKFVPALNRWDFIESYNGLIKHVSDIIKLLPALPEDKRLNFITKHHPQTFDNQHILLLANYLPEQEVEPFLGTHLKPLQSEDDILEALTLISPSVQRVLLTTYFDKVTSAEGVYEMLSMLPPHLRERYTPKTVYRFEDRDALFHFMLIIPDMDYKKRLLKENSGLFPHLPSTLMPYYSFFNKTGSPGMSSDSAVVEAFAKCLRSLPPEDALLCLQVKADEINETQDLITLLCQLPEEMRRQFSPTKDYKIASPHELLLLARSLAPDSALSLCETYVDIIKNETLFLALVGNLPEAARHMFVIKYITKIISVDGLIKCFKLLTKPLEIRFVQKQIARCAGILLEKDNHLLVVLLRVLTEGDRMRFLEPYLDILEKDHVIVKIAALLPEADKVHFIRLTIAKVNLFKKVALLGLVPEAMRSDILVIKPYDSNVQMYIGNVVAILPESDRFAFIQQYKRVMTNSQFVALMALLPITERVAFFNQYQYKISKPINMFQLSDIVKVLPETDRLPLIVKYISMIKPNHAVDLIGCLPEYVRLDFIKRLEKTIPQYSYVPENKRPLSGYMPDIIALLPLDKRLAFLNERQPKIECADELKKYLLILPLDKREAFLKDNRPVIKGYRDLEKVLNAFPDDFRLAYTLDFSGEPISTSNLCDYLNCLPEGKRLHYAIAHEKIIDNSDTLAEVIKTLPEKDKIQLLVRHEALNKMSEDLICIIKIGFSKADRQRIAEMYPQKIDKHFIVRMRNNVDDKALYQLAQLINLTEADVEKLMYDESYGLGIARQAQTRGTYLGSFLSMGGFYDHRRDLKSNIHLTP